MLELTLYRARALGLLGCLCLSTAFAEHDPSCSKGATLLRLACEFDVKEGYFENRAICANLSDAAAEAACLAGGDEERAEDLEECADVLDARLVLCEGLSDAIHDVPFGSAFAANFVDPLEIGGTVTPNPYFPLVQGYEWIYQASFTDEDGDAVTETITVTIKDEVKLIEGIRCLTVTDIVEEDGEIIEVTDDWYAQDNAGNVWYCGEIAQDFEYFDGDEPEEPELVEIEGSWKSGRDRAKAGILIPINPQPGDVFRQEIAHGDAEDAIEILSVTGSESTPAASCVENCLVTNDRDPLSPDSDEDKYYAPNVGLILEIDNEDDIRAELIEFTAN